MVWHELSTYTKTNFPTGIKSQILTIYYTYNIAITMWHKLSEIEFFCYIILNTGIKLWYWFDYKCSASFVAISQFSDMDINSYQQQLLKYNYELLYIKYKGKIYSCHESRTISNRTFEIHDDSAIIRNTQN